MKTLEDALAAIEQMKADHEAEKASILNKNKELVDREKAAKVKADEAQAAREAAEEDAERKAGDITAIEKRLTDKFQKEIDKLTAERDTLSTDLRTIRVDNEITRALAEGNVFEHNLEPLTYMFKAKAKYENGTGNIDGKAIGEYISEYLAGEVGSNYRRGSTNSGASAAGNTNTTVYKDHGFTKENFSSREGDFLRLAMTEPAKAKAIALEVNRPDLAADL